MSVTSEGVGRLAASKSLNRTPAQRLISHCSYQWPFSQQSYRETVLSYPCPCFAVSMWSNSVSMRVDAVIIHFIHKPDYYRVWQRHPWHKTVNQRSVPRQRQIRNQEMDATAFSRRDGVWWYNIIAYGCCLYIKCITHRGEIAQTLCLKTNEDVENIPSSLYHLQCVYSLRWQWYWVTG